MHWIARFLSKCRNNESIENEVEEYFTIVQLRLHQFEIIALNWKWNNRFGANSLNAILNDKVHIQINQV